MKIPKEIEAALKRRVKAAQAWSEADYTVSRFIADNCLEGDVDSADFFGGVEAIVNPEESADRIRQAIKNK